MIRINIMPTWPPRKFEEQPRHSLGKLFHHRMYTYIIIIIATDSGVARVVGTLQYFTVLLE